MRSAYTAYFEEEILSASPLRLVCLLYQGAFSELRNARAHLAAGRVPERCAAISKACDILAELTASLDPDSGGDTAIRLHELYAYSIGRLLQANLKKEDAPLAEVLGLLNTLSEGWAQLAEAEKEPVPTITSPAVYASAYAQSAEGASHSWSF